MAKTLLHGFWFDRIMNLRVLEEEIQTIDRVINKRIKLAVSIKRTSGFVPDMGLDDLLDRRSCLRDLIACLRLEDDFEPETSGRIHALIRMISRKRCDRFVG